MIKKWFRQIYRLNQNVIFCDLVVASSYGLLFSKTLPDPAEKTLEEAIKIALSYQAKLAWASANYFWPGCQDEENQLKLEKAKLAGLTPIVASKGAGNTVNEAEVIREAIIQTGFSLAYATIIVVADCFHSRSVRVIWKRVFPESFIAVKSVEGRWDEDHPIRFARSEWRWILINVIRHLGLIILGNRIMGSIRHPTINRA